MLDADITKINNKNFQFIHIVGAHLPFKYDINLNKIEKGTYTNIIDSSITVLEKFLKRLKENDVYDNSVIIVMADHGYGKTINDRSNPILYIKGKNEKHNYKVSNIKVSFIDLIPAFKQLINGDKTDKIFNEVNGQERRYLLYEYTNPDVLIEEIQKGNAWDEDTIVESGKKFISG
jgi:membrane-anchored protein YejM (alkaline phosphatase superfamily)